MNDWHVSITNRNSDGSWKWGSRRENECVYFNLTAWDAVMVAIAFAEVDQLVERLIPADRSVKMAIEFFRRDTGMNTHEGSFKFAWPTAG